MSPASPRGGALGAAVGVLATSVALVASAGQPAAHFCAFDCSGGSRPSRPGRCFYERDVYETDNSWVLLRTRPVYDGIMLPGRLNELPEWQDSIEANFTWEGWFRMVEPPAEKTTLLGTYGANHDFEGLPDNDAFWGGSSRRRYGGVFVSPSGELTLESNVGATTGVSYGAKSLADGLWHHVAAVFWETGGAQIQIDFRVKWVDLNSLMTNEYVRTRMSNRIKAALAELMGSGTTSEDIQLKYTDALYQPSPVQWEYAFRCSCNVNSPPENLPAKVAELRAKARLAGVMTEAVKGTPFVNLVVSGGYFVDDIEADAEDVSLPSVTEAGRAELLVDGFRGEGSLTFYPNITEEDGEVPDNIGQDGQFVLCGGKNGIAMACQVQNFRLWSIGLTQMQLRRLQACDQPDLRQVIGGPPPHGLVASYDLEFGYDNVAPGSTYPAAEGRDWEGSRYPAAGSAGDQPSQYARAPVGNFVRGGRCNYPRCPVNDPETGCPLVSQKEVRFNDRESCDSYSRLNFCRRSGDSRGRSSSPELDGCHVGNKPLSAHKLYDIDSEDPLNVDIANLPYAWQQR